MIELYKSCNLCARACGIDRTETVGYCGMPSALYVARAALHRWEEPCISGERGSGTIFFSGCSLRCSFCQNRDISRGRSGREVSIERLSEIMLELRTQGAHNVNLVTPTHYVPSIRAAIDIARTRGLDIPIVYNTSSYDSPTALSLMRGYADVYLADFKYYTEKTSGSLALAHDYPSVARRAIDEMVSQTGECRFDSDGMLKMGTIVRILLLPGHVAEAKLICKHIYSTYKNSVYISLMNQYTPMQGMPSPLDRRVTREEYRQLVNYALDLGVTNAYTQDFGTAEESFIPPFDNSGV